MTIEESSRYNVGEDALNGDRIQQLPLHSHPIVQSPHGLSCVPQLFTTRPPINDSLITDTSRSQDETIEQCLPFLAQADSSKTAYDFSKHGVPRLKRDDHVGFLTDTLHDSRSMAYDAARPWVVYWALAGLSLLGEDVQVHADR